MATLTKRLDNLEHAVSTIGGGHSVAIPDIDDEEIIKVFVHDGTEPPPELTMTKSQYEKWKAERPGEWLSIEVVYEDKASV